MKKPVVSNKHYSHIVGNRGFALVVTLSLLVLLTVVAVGLLSLSTVTLRSASQESAAMEARANARLALMIAIGELQKEMGPDMRVSAESAIFDSDKETPTIEGIAQSRWLGSYNSWGTWLNAGYEHPQTGNMLTIQDTYRPKREVMFRRWLLSLPNEMETVVHAPDAPTGWDDTNSVVLVGEGSLGKDARPDQITRAYLTSVENGGRYAWWIGGENQKASIDKGKAPRTMETEQWQTAQGDTAEVGVGGLSGFETLDDNASLGAKLITNRSMEIGGVTTDKVKSHFFDLTAHSKGVLASVRGGHLKKDLSLLLEMDKGSLPATYAFNSSTGAGGDIREPSIRPMSPELVAKNPQIPIRHFQSWTQMRHFYRLYRTSSDARVDGTQAAAVLKSSGANRWTEVASPTDITGTTSGTTNPQGRDVYMRMPLVAKITYIHSVMTQRVNPGPLSPYRLFLVYSPVYTLWNPYNIELRIPDNKFFMCTAAYRIWPYGAQFYEGTTQSGLVSLAGNNIFSPLRSGTGGDVVFKPGEFRVFSHSSRYDPNLASASGNIIDLSPGFDPQAIGGQQNRFNINGKQLWTIAENPGIITVFHPADWGGNVNNGNTPGSLDLVSQWNDISNVRRQLTCSYQHDWLKKAQCYTPITSSNPTEIVRFNFADGKPVPVGFHQLVLKGISQFDYESIAWDKDWRCRNWIQAPPFYFGSAMYASENDRNLHTQRLDNPYVVNFGPTSMSEMPKLVFHDGPRAFLGSGSNPFEKVSRVAALELPTAPVGSLAGFSGMRINPGWTNASQMNNPAVMTGGYNPPDVPTRLDTKLSSMAGAYVKALSYQSGVTGPGIGNSFLHPMIPRNDIYQYFDNSKSQDPLNRMQPLGATRENNNKFYNDYWDHVFLLNDALWDDYFVSSLANQTRPGSGSSIDLDANIDRLIQEDGLSNSRFVFQQGGGTQAQVKSELKGSEGYLKAAQHLMVDGMFNVNSTSVAAWYSLFAGIRERKVVYRDDAGNLQPVEIPDGKRIALSRFDTEVSDEEMDDPEFGATMPDGSPGWSGVRFLDDAQLMKLAEECVKQVKKRGPFLNFAEFINRRLSDDELGTMGTLQSAIDYDDASPDPASINGRFKFGPDFMLDESDLGDHEFKTPSAAVGSRFAGIPGYVIQSDLLKPIANTMAVRDDTFRIRSYGEARDKNGRVLARAWCEAVVQRVPDYVDPANEPSVSARRIKSTGEFEKNPEITEMNQKLGRTFRIESFRWLDKSEI